MSKHLILSQNERLEEIEYGSQTKDFEDAVKKNGAGLEKRFSLTRIRLYYTD